MFVGSRSAGCSIAGAIGPQGAAGEPGNGRPEIAKRPAGFLWLPGCYRWPRWRWCGRCSWSLRATRKFGCSRSPGSSGSAWIHRRIWISWSPGSARNSWWHWRKGHEALLVMQFRVFNSLV